VKDNPRGLFKYADMKRNASGYPSSMFLGSDCARDSQSIANLFAGFFQSVYVRDDWIPDNDLPTPGDGHKMCFSGLRRRKRDPARTELHQLRFSKFILRSFLTCHCLLVFFLPFGRSFLLFLCSRAAITLDIKAAFDIFENVSVLGTLTI
jgi:hypothetical protein